MAKMRGLAATFLATFLVGFFFSGDLLLAGIRAVADGSTFAPTALLQSVWTRLHVSRILESMKRLAFVPLLALSWTAACVDQPLLSQGEGGGGGAATAGSGNKGPSGGSTSAGSGAQIGGAPVVPGIGAGNSSGGSAPEG